MSNNNWMPEDLRADWDRAKADAQAARDELDKSYDPAQWTDAQHATYADIVDKAREKSKTGERMTKEEKQALKEYLKNPDAWLSQVKSDIANRREEATPDVRYDEATDSYYDRYGRECNSRGERY